MSSSAPARLVGLVSLALGASLLAGCGADDPGSAAAGGITVENCGEDLTVAEPVTELYAYDGGIISIALAAGAREELVAVTGMARDQDVLELAYPDDRVDELEVVGDQFPTLENVLAVDPQLMFAGWGYGFSEARNLVPDMVEEHDIATYLLSETCQQDDGGRGTMDAWTALTTDLRNIGELTGHAGTAEQVVADIEARRTALQEAPQPAEAPTAFLFDSGTDAIFTSGSYGGPQAIFDAAGVTNATADVDDTWTEVGWETLAAADPDVIFFVDYPGQSFEDKVEVLRSNPASRDLAAVREERFVNLPYALWVSSPLNIDAAEWVRRAVEHYGFAPESGIEPTLDITALDELTGNEWIG
ncbi:ABC transporter substrate-binding protein [Nocardioides sp. ChNu-153]|uniref:ABC transporter substrate-binding protein n=1 Tax=unclassified Nocardioides TaxID=2615069 RepID=UPI002404C3AE|nr:MULTISPECIES: ABC transporter substrate-binding protein [unclassified Nocardioides]MDF9716827.1 ABC transporter substrate-binding protein [Nocardioides sp. ChNu-99]MDN7120213.1 ABC transporter substrate-binding protein [Nocardioides sp. ChNu-153]